MIFSSLLDKRRKLAVIGLGYVGLPVALGFARKLSVIGFDINEDRITMMQQGFDPANEMSQADFDNADIVFTSDARDLKEASVFIIAVPTPVDEHNVPDISLLIKASATVGAVIKRGDYVIYESTVYPGCTEDDCVPVIEQVSGLLMGEDFKVGYSPERINPGDKIHTFENVIKVVAGCDDEAAKNIAAIYSLVVKAGVHVTSNIKVAEAAKVIENTQRDVNIALMNELAIIFDRLGVNTYEVLEAAGTKWNFLPFKPGLVGGHCIGVDPYYLTYKAAELGFNSRVILSGRYVNDNMGNYIVKKILQHVIASNSNVKDAHVLIMGATFKENVSDVRNSKVADVVRELKKYHLNVDVYDPRANADHIERQYTFKLIDRPAKIYDAIIVAVAHQEFLLLDEDYFLSISKPHALIADLKGCYRNKIKQRKYWSL